MPILNDGPRLIPADSHVSEPPELWDTRLPAALREAGPHFAPRAESRRFDHPGGFDPAERANEMAADEGLGWNGVEGIRRRDSVFPKVLLKVPLIWRERRGNFWTGGKTIWMLHA